MSFCERQIVSHFKSSIKHSPAASIDLNAAATEFNVPNNLINEITEVLSGIGLVGKQSKTLIEWKGFESAAANIDREISGPTGKLDEAEGTASQVEIEN